MSGLVDISELLAALECRIRDYLSAERTSQLTGDGLYTLSLRPALPPSYSLHGLTPPFLYWAVPERDHYRIGTGEAWRYETAGAQRFAYLSQQYRQQLNLWQHRALDPECASPAMFCAFAFDEQDPMKDNWKAFPNSVISVPAVMLEQNRGQYTLSFSTQAEVLKQQTEGLIYDWFKQAKHLLTALYKKTDIHPLRPTISRQFSKPDEGQWLKLVEQACHAIHDGEFAKVVPARHVKVSSDADFQPGHVLQQLRHHHPACVQLGLTMHDTTLVAATPERLLLRKDEQIHCDALGGTIRKSDVPEQDRQLVEALLHGSKTRREHALVVDHMKQALAEVCSEIHAPHTPSVLSLPRLHHLWTAIKAHIEADVDTFDLLQRLHPTPAVAGSPDQQTRQWLAHHEPFNRGWYTGGIGWLEANGDAEFAVLLRCALLNADIADLYAGAGIVADSDAHDELAETELKMAALLNILGNENEDDALQPPSCAVQR